MRMLLDCCVSQEEGCGRHLVLRPLQEISPGCSLEGMMLKLKLQYLATSCKELTQWKRP